MFTPTNALPRIEPQFLVQQVDNDMNATDRERMLATDLHEALELIRELREQWINLGRFGRQERIPAGLAEALDAL